MDQITKLRKKQRELEEKAKAFRSKADALSKQYNRIERQKQRKADAQKRYAAGELLAKAGLLDIDPPTLLGVLLQAQRFLKGITEEDLQTVRKEGQRLLQRDQQN